MADNLTPSQRSLCMSRVKGRNTGLERTVMTELRRRGVRFSRHVAGLPGKPDIAFKKQKVAVFIDGGFWHGYRFAQWSSSLSPFWQQKIAGNIRRDRRNFGRLRRTGWRVIRLWQHQIERDLEACVERILAPITQDRIDSTPAGSVRSPRHASREQSSSRSLIIRDYGLREGNRAV